MNRSPQAVRARIAAALRVSSRTVIVESEDSIILAKIDEGCDDKRVARKNALTAPTEMSTDCQTNLPETLFTPPLKLSDNWQSNVRQNHRALKDTMAV